jgi:hypothetical protein
MVQLLGNNYLHVRAKVRRKVGRKRYGEPYSIPIQCETEIRATCPLYYLFVKKIMMFS